MTQVEPFHRANFSVSKNPSLSTSSANAIDGFPALSYASELYLASNATIASAGSWGPTPKTTVTHAHSGWLSLSSKSLMSADYVSLESADAAKAPLTFCVCHSILGDDKNSFP